MTLSVRETGIAGVLVVDTVRRQDSRGSFARWFCASELAGVLGPRSVLQINHSLTRAAGCVRGMHYQRPPAAEMKLIRCARGRVWDVAVDLRKGSPTFMRWHAEELSAENGRMLVVPEGCAHGFQVLLPDSELLYLHSAVYTPSLEAGFSHADQRVAIAWPLQVTELSDRDRSAAPLREDFEGVELA